MIPDSSPARRVRVLVPGRARGTAVVLEEPLSFWGGFDAGSGRLIEARHPRLGEVLTGRILVMPSGKGSSSSSTVLAEAIRTGTAPAAILLHEPDPILVLGAVVAGVLYGHSIPVAVAGPGLVEEGATVEIEGDRLRVLA